MKKSLIIFLIYQLLGFSSQAQVLVLDISELDDIPLQNRVIPDVQGKVLVDVNASRIPFKSTEMTEVTLYPNWPVQKFGSNERGGVYGNMDNDPDMEIIYNIGQKTYAFNLDGTLVGGWPRTLNYPADGAPSYGDVDGDGFGEIVVTTHQTSTFSEGTVYAFEKNGANVPGFPVNMEGGPLRTPVLADLDDDGADEIIVAVRKWPEGFIHVYRGNGTMYPNFPVRMEYTPGSAVAVGDITGDGVPEIVAESYYTLHAFNTNGVILPGFPYSPGTNRVFSYSSPVLADIDGDGLRDIICGDHSISDGSGAVHVVRYNGTVLEGWPQFTSYWIYGPPSVGDIDGDGELDIAVGDQVISSSSVNKLYAWTAATGIPLPGFPVTGLNGINSQVILADLDGDGSVELMLDDNTATNSIGSYHGYNHDGTAMEGWPLETMGSTFFINPFVADIDMDGILDISGGSTDQPSGNTNLYLWNANVIQDPDLAFLPVLQYNTRHNGVFGDYLMVEIEEKGNGESGDIVVWPNPARDRLSVLVPAPSPASDWGTTVAGTGNGRQSTVSFHICDLNGRILTNIKGISSFPCTIDISELNPGFYLIRMIVNDGSIMTRKFVKLNR